MSVKCYVVICNRQRFFGNFCDLGVIYTRIYAYFAYFPKNYLLFMSKIYNNVTKQNIIYQ